MRSPWHDFKLRARTWVKLQYIPRPWSVFRSGALRFDPFNLFFRERCLKKEFTTSFCTNKTRTFGSREGPLGVPPPPGAGMCCSHGPRHYSLTNATILSPSKQAWSSVLGSGVMHLCKPLEQYKHNRRKKPFSTLSPHRVNTPAPAAQCTRLPDGGRCWLRSPDPPAGRNPLSKSQFKQHWWSHT